jgi:NAD(P)-dependent dehydrogenase (short-subunit alcohol dehydrogenase family)
MLTRSIIARVGPRGASTALSTRTFTRTNVKPFCTPVPGTYRFFTKEGEKNTPITLNAPVLAKVQDEHARPLVQDPAEKQRIITFSKTILPNLPKTLQNYTLCDKAAVVTGGARGLGFSMAQGLAEAGVKSIALFDANRDTGADAVDILRNSVGSGVTFHFVDVRKEADVKRAVEDTIQLHGPIDIVVNAAGIAPSNLKAETYKVEEFRRVLDVNLWGTFIINKTAGVAMINEGRGGSIINIASMSGSIVNYPQEQSAYNASKAGVIQLTKSLAAEWAKYGIRVNAISPGYMDTALNRVPALEAQKKVWCTLTPQGRLGDVDELNGLAVYLAGDGSKFMTGANVIIDGGYTCL